MTRRVVVSGIGVVSPIGLDFDSFSASLFAGRSATVDYTPYNAPENFRVRAVPLADFSPDLSIYPKDVQRGDRFSHLAVIAADQAIAHAGMARTDIEGPRTACIMGSATVGVHAQDLGYDAAFVRKKNVPALTLLKILPNAPVSLTAISQNIQGPSFAIASACSSAAHAIGVAADMVRTGAVDIAVTGGTEASLSWGGLASWVSMKVLSPTLCRPFSRNRDGLIIGEGAVILVLETFEKAEARGARIYAELAGFGMSADAGDMVNATKEGPLSAIRQAVTGIDLDAMAERTYVNAHGTGTQYNDILESEVILETFGPAVDRIAVSSTKAMHGHLLGAAGAIEAAACLAAINHNRIPPTINFNEPDPRCPINVTPNKAADRPVDLAISHSFAFGGLNAVLAFRRPGA